MPLRSDFNIHAVPPGPPPNSDAATTFTEPADGSPSSKLREFIQEDNRVLGIRHEIRQTPDTGEDDDRPRRVAFIVTHGMGQQVPFETLSMVGQALITEHLTRNQGNRDDFHTQVRRVRLTAADDAPELSRVEVSLHAQGKSVDAHIYESYWAPYTEGQISFLRTVVFLYTAAWNGLATYYGAMRHKRDQERVSQDASRTPKTTNDGLRHFDRWMFGKFQDMAIKPHTFRLLFLVVLSVSLLLAPALVVFTPVGRWIVSSYKVTYLHWPLALQIAIAFLALLLFALGWAVRYFVVEYMGDVAIYVSSYKVSRFDEIRNKILREACTVARQVYSAGISDHTHPCYDNVVIVGHSLGSVISYDLLNACINWDQVECDGERRVVPRTSRLITFGSPLDKTAFLFRTQVSSARNLREALAAGMQPLILDYQKFRPLETFQWINIHAPADIISGSLEYYDASDTTGLGGVNPVKNVIDPEATTFLRAHVQYWENSTLHKSLYDAAWACRESFSALADPLREAAN
jgi:hypothetical protein